MKASTKKCKIGLFCKIMYYKNRVLGVYLLYQRERLSALSWVLGDIFNNFIYFAVAKKPKRLQIILWLYLEKCRQVIKRQKLDSPSPKIIISLLLPIHYAVLLLC